jgi:hypothetical protein
LWRLADSFTDANTNTYSDADADTNSHADAEWGVSE